MPVGNANATALFVLTLSARENAHRRARVRLAWHAQVRSNVGGAFFVGNYSCGFQDLFLRCRRGYASQDAEQQAELLHELRAHGDLVLLPLVDVYRHHVHKLKLALGWILARTPARWILKADDDTFHRVALAPLWLARRVGDATPALVGRIQVGTRLPGPLLEPNKNTELNVEAYGRRTVVPPFPLGSTGYALTRAVAAYVVAHNGTELQGEDVSMGLWLDEWASAPAVRIVDAPTRFMTGDGRACLTHPKALVVGHGAMGLKNAQRCATAAGRDVGSVMDFEYSDGTHTHVCTPSLVLVLVVLDVVLVPKGVDQTAPDDALATPNGDAVQVPNVFHACAQVAVAVGVVVDSTNECAGAFEHVHRERLHPWVASKNAVHKRRNRLIERSRDLEHALRVELDAWVRSHRRRPRIDGLIEDGVVRKHAARCPEVWHLPPMYRAVELRRLKHEL